jgi:acyl carrier protein
MLLAEVEEKVIAAIRKNKKDAPVPIEVDTTFEQLKMASLDVICTVFELEETFNIAIPDDAAMNMRSVRDVVNGVALLVGVPGTDTSVESSN